MKKRRTLFMILILTILLFTLFLLVQRTFRNDNVIILPEHTAESDTGEGTQAPDNLNVVTLTPDTVQTAIKTLSRPVSYHRTQTTELFWNGGSSATTAQVAVSGNIMRLDIMQPDGTVCHTLLGGDRCVVWYDDERDLIDLNAGQYSADALQSMPTYETVLQLPSEQISRAEYCSKNGVYCIYVQTKEDENGYSDSFWISVHSGLLYFAERTHEGQLIYRFSAGEPEQGEPAESLFLLPDGTQFRP